MADFEFSLILAFCRWRSAVGEGPPWRTPRVALGVSVAPFDRTEPMQHPKLTRAGDEPPPLPISRLGSLRRRAATVNAETPLFSRLERLAVQCFQAFASISNHFASRLEIVAPGFVTLVPSTRRRWPALAPGNMSFSSICTDSARPTASIGEPAPRQEIADY